MAGTMDMFRTNTQAEVQGVWVDVTGSFRVLVARYGNKNYTSFIRSEGQRSRTAKHLASLRSDADDMAELVLRGVSQHILLGWSGMEDSEGKDIPYSTEKAHECLASYPEFYALILSIAQDINNFRDAEVRKSEGNS